MRRKEKKQGWMFVVLSLLLVVSVFVAGFRVISASTKISPNDIKKFAGVYGTITDRFELPIFEDNEASNYAIFGNLIGDGNLIYNSLVYRYAEELAPGPANCFTGYRSVEENPRIMKTTLLSEESQKEIAALFGDRKGCCFSYNYETGEIYTALSFPAYDPEMADKAYINRCFDSLYIPGSTMKVVTTIVAIDQGVDLDEITYECTGSMTLSGGDELYCAGVHGYVDFAGAIGKSCNCYFAKVANELNIDEALATLEELGFRVNKDGTEKVDTTDFAKMVSSVNMTNTTSFKNVWGFVGQGDSQVNPVDMAMIAGAIANNGKTARPYMVESIYNQDKDKFVYEADSEKPVELMSMVISKKVAEYWKAGVDRHYYTDQGLSEKVTYAKTGTAEIETPDGEIRNRSLIGIIEGSKTAFYIVVEDFGESPVPIANKLADLLPKQN